MAKRIAESKRKRIASYSKTHSLKDTAEKFKVGYHTVRRCRGEVAVEKILAEPETRRASEGQVKERPIKSELRQEIQALRNKADILEQALEAL